jgi:hypothetical protein
MLTLGKWLQKRPTPICWLVGSPQDARIATRVIEPDNRIVLSLSDASVDYGLRQFVGRATGPVTTAQLFARIDTNPSALLLFEGFDGGIPDLRLRHLLSTVAGGRWPKLGVIVTSRLHPSTELRAAAVSVIDLTSGQHAIAEVSLADAERLRLDASFTDDADRRHDLLERALSAYMAAGDIESAVDCYWTSLGNYSALARQHAIHLGARACRALNEGHPPREVSLRLSTSPGAVAVMNDWDLYASAMGDARTAVAAAQSAYELLTSEGALGEKSMLACRCATAFLRYGRVPQAMQ